MSVVFVRRWIIAFIVALGVIFIISLSLRKSDDGQDLGDIPSESFEWIDIENLTEYRQCRNSVQGAFLIVDERGFVCKRSDLSASGCCHSDGDSTKQFYCGNCQMNNCCSVYEHCVSCCLDPKKSVWHENSYKDRRYKYCFGLTPPEFAPFN